MVCSSDGREAWIKADLQSACCSVRPFCTANAVRNLIIGMEITGEKQSAFDQDHWSRLPRTTIRLFTLVGIPLVCFTTKVHIEGMAQTP
jgi:hypothetical protein